MSNLAKLRPLAVALLGAASMAIVIACGGGGDAKTPARATLAVSSSVEANPEATPTAEATSTRGPTSGSAEETPSLAGVTPDSAASGPTGAAADQLAATSVEAAPKAGIGDTPRVSANSLDEKVEPETTEPLVSLPVADGPQEAAEPVSASTSENDGGTDGGDEASAVAATQPQAESLPALMASYNEFNFSLDFDQGADVRAASGSVDTQGAINFSLGAVNTVLTWVPQTGADSLSLISGTYGIIKSSQEGIVFDTINDGEITVNGHSGVFLGFRSSGQAGDPLGGGLIGSWACAEAGTAYTLTLTGADAPVLQIRFDQLLENFTCEA